MRSTAGQRQRQLNGSSGGSSSDNTLFPPLRHLKSSQLQHPHDTPTTLSTAALSACRSNRARAPASAAVVAAVVVVVVVVRWCVVRDLPWWSSLFLRDEEEIQVSVATNEVQPTPQTQTRRPVPPLPGSPTECQPSPATKVGNFGSGVISLRRLAAFQLGQLVGRWMWRNRDWWRRKYFHVGEEADTEVPRVDRGLRAGTARCINVGGRHGRNAVGVAPSHAWQCWHTNVVVLFE